MLFTNIPSDKGDQSHVDKNLLLFVPSSLHLEVLSTHLLEAVSDCKENLEQAGKKAFRATWIEKHLQSRGAGDAL